MTSSDVCGKIGDTQQTNKVPGIVEHMRQRAANLRKQAIRASAEAVIVDEMVEALASNAFVADAIDAHNQFINTPAT